MDDRTDTQTLAWQWREGAVDRDGDHLVLTNRELSVPLAIVGPPSGRTFTVQFVDELADDDPRSAQLRDPARHELDYYLVELGEADPWAYAIYHCSTAANLYSPIHWSWHPAESAGGEAA